VGGHGTSTAPLRIAGDNLEEHDELVKTQEINCFSSTDTHQIPTSDPTLLPSLPSTIEPTDSKNLTLALVIASLAEENTAWARALISTVPNLAPIIYIVDAPSDALLIPVNKGHEAMPYLSHIIANYDTLADVTLFMHAHQYTWHNNDALGSDSAQIVQHLNPSKVLRDGYTNLRCHLDPGCPAHLHPASVTAETADINRPEELHVAQAWRELFPGTPIPEVLSQPCCAQFALSRARLRSVPLAEYVRHRDWIVNTQLEDAVAGRVWEYVWQYLWTGQWEVCPEEHVCYCDLYGVCFGGEEEYDAWLEKRKGLKVLGAQWDELRTEDEAKPGQGVMEGQRAKDIKAQRAELEAVLEAEKKVALARGKDPRLRAAEIGRAWKDGDGF